MEEDPVGGQGSGARSSRGRWTFVAIVLAAAVLVVGALLTSRMTGGSSQPPAQLAARQMARAGDPNAVPADGERLARVSKPPTNTRSMMPAGKVPAGSEFDVEFEPYGYGPQAGTVVVRLGDVKTDSSNEQVRSFARAFAGQNVLLRLSPELSGAISTGGRRQGTVVTADDGRFIVFLLTELK